jgi:uncharacterized phage protein (TIGR01671 family)
MKREIKFRVWDTFIEYWVEGDDFSLLYDFEKFHYTLDDIEERFIFQAFTGLSDKNKKEIYEGDIVFCDRHKGFKGKVFYNACGFFVRELGSHVDKGIFDGDKDAETLWSLSGINYEVIGNIYENPELLKEGK